MAVLNNIRKRSVFLILIIALALFAFIIGDLLRSGGFTGSKAQKVIGEVNGEEISTREFQQQLENASRGRGVNLNTVKNLWNQRVNNEVLNQQVEEAGINLDSEHLKAELTKSLQNDPTFADESGVFSYAKLQDFVNERRSSNPAWYSQVWSKLENSSLEQSARNVYFSMVKAGINYTNKEGQIDHEADNDKVDIKYVLLPYSAIADSTVVVSKSEIKSYVEGHASEFKTEEKRDIEYVKVDEVASLADENETKLKLVALLGDKKEFNNVTKQEETIIGFTNTTDVAQFVNDNSDIKYQDRFQFKKDVNPELATNLFDGKIDDLHGPYKDGAYFKLARLVAESKLPDSVKAKHILISWEGLGAEATRTKEEAKSLADSIKTVVGKSSKKFDALAAEFSADKSNSEKGGDLGYFTYGRMVPAFNDYVFEGKTGDLGVVETRFGYHIIEIEDQKNIQRVVKIAEIAQKIEPSEETINNIYAKVSEFSLNAKGKDFTAFAKESGYTAKPITGINLLDESLSGIGKQRSLVKWTFNEDTKIGDVKTFDLPNGYIVARLGKKIAEGVQDTESASTKVLPILRNQKKAAQLKAKISGSDLDAIAKANDTRVKTATGISLKSGTISGAGIEKKVVGTAFGLDKDKVSGAIEGKKGVFVVQVTNKTKGQELASYLGIANKNTASEQRRAQTALTNALKDKAEITDRRSELY